MSRRSVPGDQASEAILVVDDETAVRELVTSWLRHLADEVFVAASAAEALDLLAQHLVGVALLDIRLADHDGLWLAERVRCRWPSTAVVMASGVHEVAAATSALQLGAVDFLMKPFGRDRLTEAVSRGRHWHCAAAAASAFVSRQPAVLESRCRQLIGAMRTLLVQTPEQLEAMLALATAGRPERAAAARRAVLAAVEFASRLGLPAPDRARIHAAAIGIEIATALADSAGCQDDRDVPLIAFALLSAVPAFLDAAEIARSRFERFDGTGFPDRLARGAIPFESRVLAVAAAAQAGGQTADARLAAGAGTELDPHLVSALRVRVA